MLSLRLPRAAGGAFAHALLSGAVFALSVHAARAEPVARAQSERQLINWYYAAVFGTGVYSAGDRTVSVLQLPLSYRARQADHQGRWGVRLRMPVTFGFYDFEFDDLPDGDTPESISTASVLPGVEAEVWLSERWRLQPFVYVGYGWEVHGADSAALYSVGVKSRYSVPLGDGEMVLGATINHAAYVAKDTERRPFTALATGVDLYFPTRAVLWGRRLEFGMHFAHYYYVDGLLFPLADNVDNTQRSEGEIGISLRVRKPLDFKLFSADMVGLGFRGGDNVTAVRLFFGLPY
jgi:hypothetical protein